MLSVLLRVEFLLLGVVVSLSGFVSGKDTTLHGRKREMCQTAYSKHALLVGGLVAATLIVGRMHYFLPDAAIAKSGGMKNWNSSALMLTSAFESSLTFGLGMLAFWALTLGTLLVVYGKSWVKIGLMNSPFPAMVALAVMRGQAVQGIRYLVWPLFFSCLWNLVELSSESAETTHELGGRKYMELPVVITATLVGAVMLAVLPFESRLFYRLFVVRSATLKMMEKQPLYKLRTLHATAYDVGFIGYFTDSPICDMGGIVNGREVAQMSYAARLRRCALSKPEYAFGNDDSLSDLNGHMDITKWSICGEYDLRNLMHPAPHYIVAAPAVADYVCQVTGSKMTSIASHLHSPSEASHIGIKP
jgi:hypothetical protein